MIVSELIEKLKALPQDLEVWYTDAEWGHQDIYSVSQVKFDGRQNGPVGIELSSAKQ